MNMHDRGALRALAAVRHSIEFLKIRRPHQLGILGTSVGAITSALVTGYEPRISAAALIVGGAGMPEIISESDESHLSRLRDDRLKAYRIQNVETYRELLSQHIKIEPLDFINMSGKKDIWMMVGTKDLTVPTANQYKLAQAFGNAQVQTYADDHLNTIKYTAFQKTSAILSFFGSVLK
jgi:dienelactone hydrolase